jgi:hypothetical protein
MSNQTVFVNDCCSPEFDRKLFQPKIIIDRFTLTNFCSKCQKLPISKTFEIGNFSIDEFKTIFNKSLSAFFELENTFIKVTNNKEVIKNLVMVAKLERQILEDLPSSDNIKKEDIEKLSKLLNEICIHPDTRSNHIIEFKCNNGKVKLKLLRTIFY